MEATPDPLSRKLSLFLSLCVIGRAYSGERWGEGVGEDLNHTITREPGPPKIIQYSLRITYAAEGKNRPLVEEYKTKSYESEFSPTPPPLSRRPSALLIVKQ